MAEHQAPKLLVFLGTRWARLLDHFLRSEDRLRDWPTLSVTVTMAEDTLREMQCAMHALVPHTVLGALWRRECSQGVSYTDVWMDPGRILDVQTRFLATLQRLPGSLGVALQAAVDSHGSLLRAWPVCLRGVAVRHVRDRVRTLRLIPRTPAVVADSMTVLLRRRHTRHDVVQTVTDWLMDVHMRALGSTNAGHLTGEAGAEAEARRRRIYDRVDAVLRVEGDEEGALDETGADTVELDETALRLAVVDRYGPVLPEDADRLRSHLDNLATLVQTAMRSTGDAWTGAERASYGRLPEEVLHGLQQTAAAMNDTEYRDACNRSLHVLVDDPLLRPDTPEALLGESQLRPRTVYPN